MEDTSIEASSVPDVPDEPDVPEYEFCVGDPGGASLDVTCFEGTSLVAGADSVVKGEAHQQSAVVLCLLWVTDWLRWIPGHTTAEQQTNCCEVRY